MATDITRVRGTVGELTVTVSLTKKGVEQYQWVLTMLFSFLNNLRKQTPQRYLFDELKIMS